VALAVVEYLLVLARASEGAVRSAEFGLRAVKITNGEGRVLAVGRRGEGCSRHGR
jgi:hypothetical protein